MIINGGKIAADDTTENLTNNISTYHRVIARIDGPREEILKMIKSINGVVSVVADMEREKGIFDYEIEARENMDIRRELFKRVAARNWVMLGLKASEMKLEAIFLKITMGDNVVIKTKKQETALEAAERAASEEAENIGEAEASAKTEETASEADKEPEAKKGGKKNSEKKPKKENSKEDKK